MIDLELDADDIWPDSYDWHQTALTALNTAIAHSAFDNLAKSSLNLSISISLSNNDQVHGLNKEWRDKDKPTNILSFPMLEQDALNALAGKGISKAEMPHTGGEILLGDLILAYEICAFEANEKDIALQQHVTHLIIHGMLHLLGYDHIEEDEAEIMEVLEIKALASMGLPNPYSDLD